MHLSKILAFGHDTTLLHTRELILRHDGFDVVATTNRAEASRILSEHPIDLLILCHTVREPERQSLLSLAHAFHPDLKVLLLTTSCFPSDRWDRYSTTLCSLDGPPGLLAAVHQLTFQPLQLLQAS
jgi:DNA-binding response OmpR family regulator